MAASPQTSLNFLPWVRQGAATAIETLDTNGLQQAQAEVSIVLKINDAPLPPTAVRLRGPADVVGIDPRQLVRTDPPADTSDFEANCFPSIELDRPDFPWLFTPARAGAQSRLRPWLCLIVVRKQAGVQLVSTPDVPLPTLTIAAPAQPALELPDLRESWAWAHAQVVASDGSSDPSSVRAALNGQAELSLSRLVCPRVLTANTDYLACVVPTFEVGRRAGLGLSVSHAELSAPQALSAAWSLAPAKVQLPVYYSWSFRTGPEGDFASLARRLKRDVPAGLGLRTIEIGRPGFAFDAPPTAASQVELEGALTPLGGSPNPVLWSDPIAAPFEKALAEILKQPDATAVSSSELQPILAPPLYGRWHAARGAAVPGAANWFDELNLDPRWRVAAALGTRVVQHQQEALMASAWQQAFEMPLANRRQRQLQLSLAVSASIHERHLSRLSEDETLRIASPVFGRIRASSGDDRVTTLAARVARSALPLNATRTAMRRIGRQRGPITRRVAAQGGTRAAQATWVTRLNVNVRSITFLTPSTSWAIAPELPSVDGVAQAIHHPDFAIAPEGQAPAPQPSADPLPASWDYPGLFRAAAAEHLSRLRNVSSPTLRTFTRMGSTADMVRMQLDPRLTIAQLARAVVSTGDNVLPPAAPGVKPVGTETLMMTPSFPQPMYEALAELSQDALLPGLDSVKSDTVLGLATNRAFVEAYMIGLNFELGRELLWRGFPTDQQGTYFKQFWAQVAARGDIADLRTNLGRPLGEAPPGAPPEQFVMLLKSSLLRRYPNALVFLQPANDANGAELFPIFSGALPPDVSFFGFGLTPDAAVGGGGAPGYFVVIQERPSEPRFGVDVGTHSEGHVAVPTLVPNAATATSADIAHATRRRPVRIAIHASQLVTPR